MEAVQDLGGLGHLRRHAERVCLCYVAYDL
jgi:hypothetical protein